MSGDKETTAAGGNVNEDLLDKVRKLLAKAEDEGCSPAEAEALSGKAAELMARYGIDRALLGRLRPESDKPVDKRFEIENPWSDVKEHLLAALVTAMRCQAVVLKVRSGAALHVFGYESDVERAEVLWTSLLVQMQRALAADPLNSIAMGSRGRAWRRSWMLGYAAAVSRRVRDAEATAARAAEDEHGSDGTSTALVLADRKAVARARMQAAYPKLRKTRITYSGNGYRDGHAAGQRADIGGAKVGAGGGRAIGR